MLLLNLAAAAHSMAAIRAASSAQANSNFPDWVAPIAGMMLLMHAGFALMATGLGRAKNVAHTMSMTFFSHALAVTAFFVCGYALMCGGIGASHAAPVTAPADAPMALNNLVTTGHAGWGLLGAKGFFLAHAAETPGLAAWLVVMMLYMGIALAIPAGTLIERWKFSSFALFTLLAGGILFPVYGCWVWGGGWLAQLGPLKGLGHGVVDFSGSSVVHLMGGGMALVGAIVLGPRLGKYDGDRSPRPIFGHHVPMLMLGSLLLAAGYFAFNAARSYAANDARIGIITVNTALAGAAAAITSACYMWRIYGRPDPSVMCNGMLAGLVASSAGCAFVAPWGAFAIGAIAGILAAIGVLALERRGIDDPVGAISVHFVGGIWGMIAVAIFADGTFGDGYNGVAGNLAGLFYGGGWTQIWIQILGVIVCGFVSIVGGLILLGIIHRLTGGNRVSPEIEVAGLDIPEMGAPGYPEFITHIAPEQVTGSHIAAAHSRVGVR